MVRNASRALKIGVHLPFDPNFDVGIGTFYPEKFRQAYYILVVYLIPTVVERVHNGKRKTKPSDQTWMT